MKSNETTLRLNRLDRRRMLWKEYHLNPVTRALVPTGRFVFRKPAGSSEARGTRALRIARRRALAGRHLAARSWKRFAELLQGLV